ncbi:protein (fungal and plant) [Purpureocillium lavendulum]|uniref:Protein (Fungal and plant) n=1 Tax=Purpureocillium lavendulum TaxID=1247861 RepID=A0AB34G2W1_9HYPO|nr:protein (fungal and plant) [Purpureocillium lavendulum]
MTRDKGPTMRLFLLPVSTRRTFMYAQRLHVTTSPADRSYVDRGAAWAAKKWAEWEKKEAGWQRKVVDYGNHAFRRIPYEEWGLKSVPPLSARRRDQELRGKDKVELVFPASAIAVDTAERLALRLATERQGFHRQKMLWCFVGMPITIPFALVPIIPNLPFFYLVYRAWSHWKAISGGKHVQWLVENKLLQPSPSKILDQLYSSRDATVETSGREEPLLTQKQVRAFSEALDIPALEIELERAIWQVDRALTDKEHGGGGEQAAKKESTSEDDAQHGRQDSPGQDKEKKS